MKRTNTEKIALLGVFGALALVLAFLENTLLPDVPLLPPADSAAMADVKPSGKRSGRWPVHYPPAR